MVLSRLLIFVACLYCAAAMAHDKGSSGASKQPYSATPIIKQAMSDPGLAG